MRRLITKADRLAVQHAQFERYTNKGFAHEVYKGLNIFSGASGKYFELVVFWGTASNPAVHKLYRTEQEAQQAADNTKKNYDRQAAYKQECKNNPKKSTAANCAAAVREELKKNFPGIKFSVTSDNYSMGDHVRVSWTDGPTTDEVEKFTDKYQYGHFDGMTDMYEYSNTRDDIPQTKHMFTERRMSDETRAILDPIAVKLFENEHLRDENVLYRLFQKTSLPVGAVITGISRNEKMAGSPHDLYKIDFTAPQPSVPEIQTFEKLEVKAGEINIIDYSEKAIAVVGDTKPIKDKLKELGGKFNFRLSCGPGWIFPKSRLETIQNALTA